MSQQPPPKGEDKFENPFGYEKGAGMDMTLIASVSVIILIVGLIIAWAVKAQMDESTAKRRREAMMAMAAEDEVNDRREATMAGGRRRGAVRHRRTNFGDEDDGDFVDQMMAQQGGGEEMDEDALLAGVGGGEKVGKKKAAKLEMKAEKKAAREQELRDREDRKKREAEKEVEREKEREKERLEEEAEKERARKEKEEREKREQEEYERMKASFAVAEEGFDQVEGEEAENLMQAFIDYVKECKVVNMDELGSHFSLKTEEAIDRLQHFLSSGDLTGVMDDRGKFIYITEEEYAGVAKFINQRGRVTINELAEYSNRLIKLES
ncbi:ufbp-1 [Pristionchus pacificus]|uniref:DDRGK domain-containing protein 1 n=1 Tax=Pristionchus pacificus TaxID=54126 RepID=A0A2A6B4Y0_PRIPA|nr:ufbp-1 [Pristionchus pacificus]|eukprot:PDM60936.1 ufbp-1 [Pristionchus pacificus]